MIQNPTGVTCYWDDLNELQSTEGTIPIDSERANSGSLYRMALCDMDQTTNLSAFYDKCNIPVVAFAQNGVRLTVARCRSVIFCEVNGKQRLVTTARTGTKEVVSDTSRFEQRECTDLAMHSWASFGIDSLSSFTWAVQTKRGSQQPHVEPHKAKIHSLHRPLRWRRMGERCPLILAWMSVNNNLIRGQRDRFRLWTMTLSLSDTDRDKRRLDVLHSQVGRQPIGNSDSLGQVLLENCQCAASRSPVAYCRIRMAGVSPLDECQMSAIVPVYCEQSWRSFRRTVFSFLLHWSSNRNCFLLSTRSLDLYMNGRRMSISTISCFKRTNLLLISFP